MRTAAAFLFFVVAAVVWTYPLAWHASTHLIGTGLGDNALFLWNFWWAREVLAGGLDPFRTSALFAPFGTDLLLHTHTALPAAIGATLFGAWPTLAAHNAVVVLTVALNGFTAYLLAMSLTSGRVGAAMIAGLVYGGSPFVAAHLLGHLNLVSAWTLPLIAWGVLEALRRRSARAGAVAGLAFGVTAYLDYYHLVYGAGLALTLMLVTAAPWVVERTPLTRWRRRLLQFAAPSALLILVVVLSVVVTGGYDWHVGGRVVHFQTTFNLPQIGGLLVVLGATLWYGPALRRVPTASAPTPKLTRAVTGFAGAAGLVLLPLAWHAVSILEAGEYVTQRVRWRSSQEGVDLAVLALGNPNGWQGAAWVQAAYQRLGINAVENGVWLGVAPVCLAVWALRRHWPTARPWAAVGGWSLLWSLGPFLAAFGVGSGVVLPFAFLRLLPFVSNARIPGRASVLVYLALAMLAAIAVASWRTVGSRRLAAIALAVAAVGVDYFPAPFPLVTLSTSSLYERLRDRPEPGAVCELPMGLRDGFGVRGAFDERVLVHQMTHRRPLVGGFVARLSPTLQARYENDPLLRALLDLSEPTPRPANLPDSETARRALAGHGIRFIVLDVAAASDALEAYVRDTLPTTLLEATDGRELYLVEAAPLKASAAE